MRRSMVAVASLVVAPSASTVALAHRDPKPDPLRGQSHVARYWYTVETVPVRKPPRGVTPDGPTNLVLSVKTRVFSHDTQRALIVEDFGRSDVQKVVLGDTI